MNGSVLIISEVVAVRDADQFANYQAQARQQLSKFGGVTIARGAETIEGNPPLRPLVVQRWPSELAFRQWQESDDYRPLLALRREAAEIRLIIIPEI